MNSAYIAICYMCNEKCRFCPYGKDYFEGNMIPLEELKNIALDMKTRNNIDTITISGGEPTLHPQLWDFIQFLTEENFDVVLLTNGEHFADSGYIKRIENKIEKKNRLSVITTLHSHLENEHEFANQTPGSMKRTLKGLLALTEIGIHVIVKHCITKENYKQLVDFYKFVNDFFKESVDIQLCSIDYCGMNRVEAENEKLQFILLKPYIEQMFDLHISEIENGNKRLLYCINMPLCSADPYYWKFFVARNESNYDSYAEPSKEESSVIKNAIEEDVFPASLKCKECMAYEICPGTYKSAFEFFPDDIVIPYKK